MLEEKKGARANKQKNIRTDKENMIPDLPCRKNERISKFIKSIDTPRQSKILEKMKENKKNEMINKHGYDGAFTFSKEENNRNLNKPGVPTTFETNIDLDINNISEEIRLHLESKNEESEFLTLRNLIECTELNSIENLKSEDGRYSEPGVPSLLVLNRTVGSKASMQSIKFESFVSPKGRLAPGNIYRSHAEN
jgi:hypothetical protein